MIVYRRQELCVNSTKYAKKMLIPLSYINGTYLLQMQCFKYKVTYLMQMYSKFAMFFFYILICIFMGKRLNTLGAFNYKLFINH